MGLVKPKKFLGQHFLKDLSIAKDIADTVDVCPDLPILEVGPGMGVLTQFIMQKNRPVKVVELDYESVAYLRENFPALEDNIIEDDFLKLNLEKLFDEVLAYLGCWVWLTLAILVRNDRQRKTGNVG